VVKEDRISYLDNLRFSLVALVICHHANAAYGSIGGWSYTVHERSGFISELLANMFAGITQAFFMSSFFMISAYFTAATFEKKGPVKFVRRRLVRLGIPLLVYFFVLSLVLRYFIFKFEGRDGVALSDFFLNPRYTDYRSMGPLWFAFTLLIFEGAYLIQRGIGSLLDRKPRTYPLPNDRQVLAFILGIGVFTFFWRMLFPLTAHVFHLRLAFFPLYVAMFTFGVIAWRSGWFSQLTARQANRWFKAALVAMAVMPLVMLVNQLWGGNAYSFWERLSWQSLAYSMWEPFICVGVNIKLIVFFRERFNFSNSLTKTMARSSFTAYITHAFFIVFLTYAFTFFSLGRLPEILLMWPIAVTACFLTATVISRAPLLRRVL